MSCTLIHLFVVSGHDVLSRIFPFVNKGMHPAIMSFVPGMPVARMRVVLMRTFVPVRTVTVVVLFVPVLHRRVTSAGMRRVHGAATRVAFCVPSLRQLLVLIDRSTVRSFRHGNDLARE